MLLRLSVLTIFALFTAALASAPTSFCKCTCFTNSTIISLDPPSQDQLYHNGGASGYYYGYKLLTRSLFARTDEAEADSSKPRTVSKDAASSSVESKHKSGKGRKGNGKQYRAGNCNDCNRQFCLDYNLPICKGAKDDDIFTTCFQRDSRKDETIVFIFIIATTGLLVYAALKPWAQKVIETARERRMYIPVSNHDES